MTDKPKARYTSVTIEGFRLFEHLELTDLAPVNLFFGPNNVGKTSILEAIYTHACGHSFDHFLRRVVTRRTEGLSAGVLGLAEQILHVFRDRSEPPYTFAISAQVLGDETIDNLTASFEPGSVMANLDPRTLGPPSDDWYSDAGARNGALANVTQLELYSFGAPDRQKLFLGAWETQINDGETTRLNLYLPFNILPVMLPFKLGVMHDILAHRSLQSSRQIFASLKRYRLLADFTAKMRQVFEDVDEIDLYPYPDGTSGVVMIVTSDGQQCPLYVSGDGMRRWYHLLGNMIVYRDAVHCIEEIDATFHPAAQPDLARLLVEYANTYNNQLFLTSHSIEFLDAFLQALYAQGEGSVPDEQDPVRVFTIMPPETGVQPVVWSRSGRQACDDRRKYGMELRG